MTAGVIGGPIHPGVFGLPYELGFDQVGMLEEGPLDLRAYILIASHLFGGTTMHKDPTRPVACAMRTAACTATRASSSQTLRSFSPRWG